MITSSPRFSVLIPTYNGSSLLGATIDAVLAQSCASFEVIVVDDGSTDRTPELLAGYGSRIVSIRQENKGAEVARHAASKVARGEYLVLLDHDDLLLPGALAVYDSVVRTGDCPALIIGALRSFHSGQPVPSNEGGGDKIEVVKFENYFARDRWLLKSCSQIILKKSVVENTDVLPAKPTAFPVDSCDIMLSVGHLGPCVAVMEPVTVAYRLHDGNSSGSLDKMVRLAPVLIGLERAGRYKSGNKHRLDRYAYIGGMLLSYLKDAIHAHRYGLALGLFIRAFPMFAAALMRKISHRIKYYSVPSVLIPKA